VSPMGEAPVRVAASDLLRFATDIFAAAGVQPAMAQEWAHMLVWANLRGVDSHGVLRIPRYLDLLANKAINVAPDIRVERRTGAIVVLEADRAPGAVAMTRAAAEAVERARALHVGWCAVRNTTHPGAIGYFAARIAEAGMAGIVMTASGPLMAYAGARVAGVSTNPLAIAIPAGRRRPFLLDMSTATVANGKILNARDAGTAIPLGWGIDRDGRDTTDPAAVATLLPLGGPKGSGLSLMIECLASLTVANPLIARILQQGPLPDGPVMNGVAIAVDIAAFGDLGTFTEEVDRLGDAVTALPRASGVDRIFAPGERGDTVREQRERDGVPVPIGTWKRLVAAAAGVGVGPPVA
jgi:ureidoglycolate dehydrogenase (NAD+)